MELKEIGSIIYLCEGTKPFKRTDKNTMIKHVELVNTDWRIIKIFVDYLRSLGIDENRLKGRLFIHDEKNTKEYMKFWSDLTEIPLSRFGKIMVKKGSVYRRNKCPKGIFVVRYHDKEIFEKIEKDIESTLNKSLVYKSF